MSAIETYLQYIASKVLARDVRTAIVNAIRQCYDDVHNPTLNTEALQAAIQAKIDAGQMAALTIGDRTITAAKLALGVIPTPDTTLSQSGVPADAKKTGDEITALNESLEYQAIPTNSDLNNYYEKGKYYIGGTNIVVANFPLSSVVACIIDVNPLSNGLTSQVATMVSSGTIYTRWRMGNGTWGAWRNLTENTLLKCVRFDVAQTKTEAEKATARANIGVSDSAGLSERAQYMLLRCLRDAASSSENGKFYVDSLKYALNENLQFVYGLGFNTASVDGQEVTYTCNYGNVTRIGMFSNEAVHAPFNKFNASQSNIKAYPILVPQGATALVLTKPESLCGIMTACRWDSTNNVWVRKKGFAGEKTSYNPDMSADVSGINDGTYCIVYTFVSTNPITGEVTDLKAIDLTALGYEFT